MFIIEEFLKFIFELISYKLGKVVVSLFFPFIHIPKYKDEKKQTSKHSLTYVKKGKRYFFTDTITLIGVLTFIILIGLIVFLNM